MKKLILSANKAFLIMVLVLCVVGLSGFSYLGVMTYFRSNDAIEFKFIVYLCVLIFDFIMVYIFSLAFNGIRALLAEPDTEHTEIKEFAMVIVALFTLLIALVAVVLGAENFIRVLFK